MKYTLAATLLASIVCAQNLPRDNTRLFSIPPQPTPLESTPSGLISILPVSMTTPSQSASVSDKPSGTEAPTTIGHITPDPTTSGSGSGSGSATTPTVSSSGQTTAPTASQTQSGSGSGSSSGTPSSTSNPAAAPTAFGNNLVAGVIALAGLAVAI